MKYIFQKPEYFGYLTSEQALADFVDVIYHVKQNMTHKKKKINHEKRSSPVIAFGGSYGGMLAAWMRMKYPAVIDGLVTLFFLHLTIFYCNISPKMKNENKKNTSKYR